MEVTKEFSPVLVQGIATASNWLGNVDEYQQAQMVRDYLQQEIAHTQDAERLTELNIALNQVDNYLIDNQIQYKLFKEGGLGRAGLHAVGGGILTGDVSGAAGAGITSLSAPIIAQVTDNSGSLKPVVDTVSGLAIGYLSGGTTGAFTGANADWNNRQLHPSEYKKAEEYAEIVAKKLGISKDEALGRIVRHMLRTVDYETATADDFRIDQEIISLIGVNNLPKRDEHYYDTHYNEQYIETYTRDVKLGRQNARSGKTPAEIKAYNKGVVTDIFKAAGNTVVGVYETFANTVTGEIFPESPGYVHIERPFEYTHDEYGNALETTMTFGVATVAAGRWVSAGNTSKTTAKNADDLVGTVTPPSVKTNIPNYVQGSLSQTDEQAFRATLAHIDNGTVPTGALSKKWGTPFKNYEGKLPSGSGANSTYREYRVSPSSGQTGAGTNRVVETPCKTRFFHYSSF